MKKLILLLILLPTLCFAGALQEKQREVLAKKNGGVAACTDANPVGNCTGFMFCQNFQTATTGYDNSETWTSSGTVDPVSTSPALRGTQSCSFGDASTISIATGGTYTEIYTFARYQFTDATPSAATYIYDNLDGANRFGSIRLGTDGKLICYHGTVNVKASTALSDATKYYIWTYFKASSGAGDGIMTATVSTTRDPSEATAALGCSVTTGDSAEANIDSVRFGNVATSGAGMSIDQILVKTSTIGKVCE
jgi:hypothetical protein